MDAVVPSEVTLAPNERSISSVWLRESTGSVTLVIPSAYKPAKSIQEFYLGRCNLEV